MSQCPDAADAEAAIASVMENVGHKVQLNFTYIASYGHPNSLQLMYIFRWRNTIQGPEITCKHGPTECLGNRQQLWLILPFAVSLIQVCRNITLTISSHLYPA